MEELPPPEPIVFVEEVHDFMDEINHAAGLSNHEKALLIDIVGQSFDTPFSQFAQIRHQENVNLEQVVAAELVAEVEVRGRIDYLYCHTFNPTMREWCRFIRERLPEWLTQYQ